MYLGKVVSVLSALNKKELSKLENYLASPYFEVPGAARSLFNYLQAQYPAFDEKKIQPALIAKKEKALSTEAIQKKAGSDLLKAVEHFMALEEMQQGKFDLSLYKIEAFRHHHLFDAFEKECEKMQQEFEQCADKDIRSFWFRHRNTEAQFNTFDARVRSLAQPTDINEVLRTLDEFHAIKTVRYLCESVNRMNVLGVKHHPADIQKLTAILQPYTNASYPYVNLFVNALNMVLAEDYTEAQKYYVQIKEEVERSISEPVLQSIKEVVTYAIQWNLKWGNRGYYETYTEYLWWVELKMKYNLMLDKQKITPSYLINALTMAIKAKRSPTWIKKFMEAYAPYLPANSEQFENFGWALCSFAAGKHTEALRRIRLAQSKEDAVFNAMMRRWEFVINYEADPENAEQLLNQLEAYKKYVARHANTMRGKAPLFEKFIKYCTYLVKGKPANWKKELAAENYFAGKEWLDEIAANKKAARNAPAPNRLVV